MSVALAARLGNNPATIAGAGTTQGAATPIKGQTVNLLAPTSGNTAFVLSLTFSTGRPVYAWNTSASFTALVFPPSAGTINGQSANASVSLAPGTGGMFMLANGSGVASENWWGIGSAGTGGGGSLFSSGVPQQVYNAVSTAPTTNNLQLTGANITGGSVLVVLNLTTALGAGATATLPTVANLVTAMTSASLNPTAGSSYELDIYNSSSGNFAWTTTTNTGWTLSGTAQTIAQNTTRKYIVTLTTLTAATLQSIGEFTITAAA